LKRNKGYEMKELGIHVKEVEKEQQNKPKEKRRGKKQPCIA